VGQFVDEDNIGTAGKGSVQIEFLKHSSAILDGFARHQLEPLYERFRFGSPMRLDDADHDIDPISTLFMGGFEHGIRFPHARVRAKKYLQFSF
jgi:hypothetical protein